MPLSCYCFEDREADWYFDSDPSYTDMPNFARRRRCKSCKTLLEPDATVLQFRRFRTWADDIEYRIHGDWVDLAPWWHCETCGDLYLSLAELDFCVDPSENMHELLAEYHSLYAPNVTSTGDHLDIARSV